MTIINPSSVIKRPERYLSSSESRRDAGTALYSSSVDLAATGSTLLGTTRSDQGVFYPIYAIFHVLSASGASGAPEMTIGTNSPNYDNILASFVGTGLTSTDSVINQPLGESVYTAVAASTGIYVDVDVALAAGSGTARVAVYGFYQS